MRGIRIERLEREESDDNRGGEEQEVRQKGGTKGSEGANGYSKMPLPVPAGDAKALVSRSESPNFRETAVLPNRTDHRSPASLLVLWAFLLFVLPSSRALLFHSLPFRFPYRPLPRSHPSAACSL